MNFKYFVLFQSNLDEILLLSFVLYDVKILAVYNTVLVFLMLIRECIFSQAVILYRSRGCT